MKVYTDKDKNVFDKNYILTFVDSNTVHNISIPSTRQLNVGYDINVFYREENNIFTFYQIVIDDMYLNENGIKIYTGKVINKQKKNDSNIIFRDMKNVIYYSSNASREFDYIIEFPDWEGNFEEEDEDNEGYNGNSDK